MVQVTVVRNSARQEISIFDLLVGDILLFGYGDILPVDGVLMSGSLIRSAKCTDWLSLGLIENSIPSQWRSAAKT